MVSVELAWTIFFIWGSAVILISIAVILYQIREWIRQDHSSIPPF